MSDIPEAREQLLLVAKMADKETAARIRYIVNKYMRREKYVRRAPVKMNGVTPAIRGRILELARANPRMHVSEIAAAVNVNPGRVSEVLTGKR